MNIFQFTSPIFENERIEIPLFEIKEEWIKVKWNRSIRRKMSHEITTNVQLLAEFDDEILEIIRDDEEYNYDLVYQNILERWNIQLDWMLRNRRFKYTQPNIRYFADCYQPRETIKY